MTSTLQQAALAALDHPVTSAGARIERPAPDEHHPYYSAYIDLVPSGDFATVLRQQAREVAALFGAFTPAQASFAYAPGKWTLTQLLGHLTDTERVFTYRALSIARQDPAPLPGYSQDDWMEPSGYTGRTLPDVLAEWLVVRAATVAMVEGLPAAAPTRRGIASDRPFSVRALLHVPPGHTAYHLAQVRERYLTATGWPA